MKGAREFAEKPAREDQRSALSIMSQIRFLEQRHTQQKPPENNIAQNIVLSVRSVPARNSRNATMEFCNTLMACSVIHALVTFISSCLLYFPWFVAIKTITEDLCDT